MIVNNNSMIVGLDVLMDLDYTVDITKSDVYKVMITYVIIVEDICVMQVMYEVVGFGHGLGVWSCMRTFLFFQRTRVLD